MGSEEKNLILGTAGHIDHGKTALVRALTGMETDRLPAEKQRGITIDLGFASLTLGPYHLALIDVPGHERFIRNMLAGASGLDLAMLVVAADDSVMPQTREHLEILQLLELSGGVIALTKCDIPDPSWVSLVQEEVRELVRGTFLENAAIVRTSAVTGQGIDDLKTALAELCGSVEVKQDSGLFRMAIDRSFTVAGHGTVVTGTVASGRVSVGDELEWLPAGRSVRVRGLHRHDEPVESIGRGSRAAINLVGVHHGEVSRGDELAASGYLTPTRVISVELSCSPHATKAIRHRARYRVHLGTTEALATLTLLEGNALAPGSSQLGQLFVAQPVVAVYGQPLILREESPPATVGGGRVLQPVARKIRRRDQPAINRLKAMRSSDPLERLASALASLGLDPWSEKGLCARTGLPIEKIGPALEVLTERGTLVNVLVGPKRSAYILSDVVVDLEDRVFRALGRLHAARPRQSAIPLSYLAAELGDLQSPALILGIVERLKARGKVVVEGRTVAVKGYEPRLSQAERRLKGELLEQIRQGGMSPPESAELTKAAGARGAVVPELLALLRDEQKVVEISPSLYIDFDVESKIRAEVVEHLSKNGVMTMAELRNLLGTTRKYAVPIGEHLDRIGLTKRDGDLRRLGEPASPT